MTSPRRRTRRSAIERSLKRLRSSGRVKTVSPPSETIETGDPFRALHPDADSCDELEALRQEARDLRRLHEAIHFLGGAPDLMTLRGDILDLAVSVSGLKRGFLALRVSSDDGAVRYKIKNSIGFDAAARSSREGKLLRKILNRALEAKETLLEGDILEEGILGHATPRGGAHRLRLGAVACLPLQAGGDLLGALLLDDPERREPFTQAEESLLRSFARHAALALNRLSEVRRLRRRVARLERRSERLQAQRGQAVQQARRAASAPELELAYPEAKEAFTERYLRRILDQAGGDLRAAAEAAGLPLARLIGLMNHLGVDPRSSGDSLRWGGAALGEGDQPATA